MRLAFIAGTYQPQLCGVAHYTARLRESLASKGVTSIVFTTTAAATQMNHDQVKGVVDNWQLSSLLPLIQAIDQAKPDILHIQHAAGTYDFERAIFLLPLLLRLSGWSAPIVTTVHEYGWWEWQPKWIPAALLERLKNWGQQRGWWDREDGFLLTKSNAIITTTAQLEQTILSRLPDVKSHLHRIEIAANLQNCFELDCGDRSQVRQSLRQLYGWDANSAVIVFFGFLHPVKGLEMLLAAFQQVSAIAPQVRLLLMGGIESLALPGEQARDYGQTLKQTIAALNLVNQVEMTGYLEPELISAALAGADLGVLPFNHGVTLKSGSLLSLFAHSLPVIATRAHPPEMELENPALIQLVPPRNVADLSSVLIKLLKNPQLRQQMGRTAKEFSQRFSWEQIGDRHLRIYQQIIHS